MTQVKEKQFERGAPHPRFGSIIVNADLTRGMDLEDLPEELQNWSP